MCGIAGFIGPWPADALPAALHAMRLRGPDGTHATRIDDIQFGSTRLAIVDPAGGAQPFTDQTGRFIVHGSGEIYNAPELRRELTGHGHLFRSQCDLEVVAHAWAQWGSDAIGRFNGMFAIALWDRAERQLHLMRDPCGQKPLLYWQRDGRFAFASELRALTAAGIPREIRPEAIHGYLALRYIPEPDTAWRHIHHLPGGHHLAFRDGKIVKPTPFPPSLTPAELDPLRRDAVDIATRADVPAVLYLSGGVDSWMLADAAKGSDSIRDALTFDFPAPLGEGQAAAEIARYAGLRHHRIDWKPDDLNRLPALVEQLESPVGDALIVAFDRLAEATTALGAKVALSGEGPDEWFGGYGFHRAALWGDRIQRIGGGAPFRPLAALVHAASPLTDRLAGLRQPLGNDGRDRIARWLAAWPGASREEQFNGLRRLFTPAEILNLASSSAPFCAPPDLAALEPLPPDARGRGEGSLRAALLHQATSWLPAWAIGRHEKIAMARGIEVRMPFLDPRLAALTRADSKRQWRACARRAGWSQAHAPKQAFAMPAVAVVRSAAFATLAGDFLSPSAIRARGWFRPEAVAAMAERARHGSFLAAKQWAALVILEIWARAQDHPA